MISNHRFSVLNGRGCGVCPFGRPVGPGRVGCLSFIISQIAWKPAPLDEAAGKAFLSLGVGRVASLDSSPLARKKQKCGLPASGGLKQYEAHLRTDVDCPSPKLSAGCLKSRARCTRFLDRQHALSLRNSSQRGSGLPFGNISIISHCYQNCTSNKIQIEKAYPT
jgi:hypothetical protein